MEVPQPCRAVAARAKAPFLARNRHPQLRRAASYDLDHLIDSLRVTSQAGYKMVLWSVLTNDFQGATPRSMRHRIMQGADDGAIVLMHSGMPNTVEMLPEVMRSIGWPWSPIPTGGMSGAEGRVCPSGAGGAPV